MATSRSIEYDSTSQKELRSTTPLKLYNISSGSPGEERIQKRLDQIKDQENEVQKLQQMMQQRRAAHAQTMLSLARDDLISVSSTRQYMQPFSNNYSNAYYNTGQADTITLDPVENQNSIFEQAYLPKNIDNNSFSLSTPTPELQTLPVSAN